MKEKINIEKEKCKNLKQKVIDDLIQSVPETQRELLGTIIKTAKTPKKGRRYTTEWVYECFLMKTKANNLYTQLQKENKMPLPSHTTLLRYLRRLRPYYGFDENVFRMMKKKSKFVSPNERRGESIPA